MGKTSATGRLSAARWTWARIIGASVALVRFPGRRVAAVAFQGFAREGLAELVDEIAWVHVGQVQVSPLRRPRRTGIVNKRARWRHTHVDLEASAQDSRGCTEVRAAPERGLHALEHVADAFSGAPVRAGAVRDATEESA